MGEQVELTLTVKILTDTIYGPSKSEWDFIFQYSQYDEFCMITMAVVWTKQLGAREESRHSRYPYVATFNTGSGPSPFPEKVYLSNRTDYKLRRGLAKVIRFLRTICECTIRGKLITLSRTFGADLRILNSHRAPAMSALQYNKKRTSTEESMGATSTQGRVLI